MPAVAGEKEASYRNSELAQQVIVSRTLDLISLNVAHGRGTALNQLLVSATQHRKNLREIAAILLTSDADVVALQEADAPSLWSGKFDHLEYLAEATGYMNSVHGYHADSWPYTYGAALMSKFKMSHADSHRFRPSWPTAGKGYVRGTVLWRSDDNNATARPVTLVSVHLDFSRLAVRKAQIAELVDDLDELRTPLIIMGDFNADWSTEDSPVRMLARGLGLRAFKPTTHEFSTYNGVNRLDWILISDELTFVDFAVLPDIVSDHLAVEARIGWQQKD
ncbi:MAG: hypothetical protein DRR06_13060 [Gammaproteobacteria bacterium]|nr:MAG: hypothetical protein DRR06_13060 [Gammaproteobacteria bacterium]